MTYLSKNFSNIRPRNELHISSIYGWNRRKINKSAKRVWYWNKYFKIYNLTVFISIPSNTINSSPPSAAYVSVNWVSTGSDNDRHQAIIWTNVGILKMHLKMSSARMAAVLSRWLSEWLNLTAFLGTGDSEAHIVHVITAYILESSSLSRGDEVRLDFHLVKQHNIKHPPPPQIRTWFTLCCGLSICRFYPYPSELFHCPCISEITLKDMDKYDYEPKLNKSSST